MSRHGYAILSRSGSQFLSESFEQKGGMMTIVWPDPGPLAKKKKKKSTYTLLASTQEGGMTVVLISSQNG